MSKTITREYQYDVVVVGGGTAGVSAAVGAAQAGAKTLLIERNAYLGGEATHSGVGAFCGFYTCGESPVRVVAGVGDLVLEEMGRLGSTYREVVSAAGNRNINFKPEYLKCALDRLLCRAGVDCLLHAMVIDVQVKEGQIQSITCADDEGWFAVKAAVYVDTSGDANLAHMAGASTQWGDKDGKVQVGAQPFRLSGVDVTQEMTPAAVGRAVAQARQAGIPNLPKEKGFVLKLDDSQIVSVLLPSAEVTGLSARSLTEMERETREQALSYARALKEFMPGMEHSELAVIGPAVGLRETRRLVGRDVITADDVLTRRKRPDVVARGGWKPEIHKDTNQMGVYLDVPGASYFDVPLGALRSADLDNLYGAGRMISTDAVAHAATRVMGTCFATGHAAGVAAACQAREGTVDVSAVQEELRRQGALV